MTKRKRKVKMELYKEQMFPKHSPQLRPLTLVGKDAG